MFEDWQGAWGIAGGWALDLHLGRQSRPHDDIDVLLPLADYGSVYSRLASEWELHLAEKGRLTRLGAEDRLTEETDIWARRDSHSPWAFQLMLIDVADGWWTYRRERSIRRPAAELFLRTEGGIPYLRPEIQLLYKGGSVAVRDKDQRDLDTMLPSLNEGERDWLLEAVRAQFPQGHGWLERLEKVSGRRTRKAGGERASQRGEGARDRGIGRRHGPALSEADPARRRGGRRLVRDDHAGPDLPRAKGRGELPDDGRRARP